MVEERSEVLCNWQCSLLRCSGSVTVVWAVGFEVLAHLDYVHQGRGKEEKEGSSVSEG